MSLSRLSSALTGTVTEVTVTVTENLVRSETEKFSREIDLILGEVEYNGTRMSLRAWSRHTGISEPTLRYRHRRGWTAGQTLGYDVAPQRDRAKEQSGKHQTNVVVTEAGREISRREAATILKIEPQSLRRRLKQYRHQGQVTLTELKQSSRKL